MPPHRLRRASQGLARCRVAPSQFSQFAVHSIEVDLLRVELPAHPLQHFFMALVLWVGNRLDELGVAPHPSTVLRWACPLTLDAPGILDLRLWFQGLLQDDLMLPRVAEVVFIGESGLPPHLDDLAD